MSKARHVHLIDEPGLAAGFSVWLCSGEADWAKGRYLSCNWDVGKDTPQRSNFQGRFAGPLFEH